MGKVSYPLFALGIYPGILTGICVLQVSAGKFSAGKIIFKYTSQIPCQSAKIDEMLLEIQGAIPAACDVVALYGTAQQAFSHVSSSLNGAIIMELRGAIKTIFPQVSEIDERQASIVAKNEINAGMPGIVGIHGAMVFSRHEQLAVFTAYIAARNLQTLTEVAKIESLITRQS
jgi:hypothetical protein